MTTPIDAPYTGLSELETYAKNQFAKLGLATVGRYEGDLSTHEANRGTVHLDAKLLPERGIYRGAFIHFGFTATPERQGVTPERGAEHSRHELLATTQLAGDWGWEFGLEDPDTGDEAGWGILESEDGGYNPSHVEGEGDTSYLTVELVYDEARTIEHAFFDESEIPEKRQRARDILEEDHP